MVLLLLVTAALLAQQPAAPHSTQESHPAAVDFDFYRTYVEPIFLVKRAGAVRCATCHAGAARSEFRLQPLPPGAQTWTEQQSRQNFEGLQRLIAPGRKPEASRLLMHPLAREAGGDSFHGGGRHWLSRDDPEWQIVATWIRGERV